MPLQAIDVQTNIANIGKLAKENNTQQLVERGQIFGQSEAARYSKEISSRLFSIKELLESEQLAEFQEDEEQQRRKMRKQHEQMQEDQLHDRLVMNEARFQALSDGGKGRFLDFKS
jgi:hypothetical protein